MDAEVLADGLFEAAQISVAWEAARPVKPVLQRRIDSLWAVNGTTARDAGRELFNGPIVALRGFSRSKERLTLTLGPSDYKTFMATCVWNREYFSRHARETMAPGLGNSALLTCGATAYLGVRSARVASYGGRGHVFGGVLPPREDGAAVDMAHVLGHLAEELAEELALTRADLAGPPVLLGLFRDEALGQPELVWRCALKRPPAGVDSHEHERLYPVARGGGEAEGLLTPIARRALKVWREAFPL